MSTETYPRIRVSGTPRERGRQYGERAREQVLHSRAGYERSFAAKGIAWPAAVEQARGHAEAIRTAHPSIWEELVGIAEGSGLPLDDVLAMNCRTEIMWAAVVDHAVPGGGECSSFAVAPTHTADGTTLVGQNWDWLVLGFDSVVVLEVEREDGPDYVTIVEAGLLAKTLLNSAGVGVAVNTLVTSLDGHAPGLPFHVLIRALADARHTFDAVEILAAHPRASAGNFVVGAAGGAILNIETAPGDARNVVPLIPENGRLFHTNHFLGPIAGGFDLAPVAMADSYVRLDRLGQLVGSDSLVTVPLLAAALTDHTDAPGSICCHPDERSAPEVQWSTVMSVVMDLERRTLHLAEGNPCTSARHARDYAELLGAVPAAG
ncbi:acyl-CoA--6-aminopenicillanic acid acyl-transferase [Arthrobacter ginkgonis]|uniref:Acyl-CoA--6-aminopenicillanic acid acyl-transferase n=1 Tax=Arthrobacter ginkgonis TaxID=1630594 RepID=A0ABP7C5G5_9MICC